MPVRRLALISWMFIMLIPSALYIVVACCLASCWWVGGGLDAADRIYTAIVAPFLDLWEAVFDWVDE